MTKLSRIPILIFFMCFVFNDKTQAQNCTESTAQEYIQGNDMKVVFRNGGDMFWDGSEAQCIVPYAYQQPVEISSLFAGAVWMGGYDSGGNLRLAAQTYRSGGNDYWSGPLDSLTGLPYNGNCTDFDKIWEVKRWAIERHIADFDDDGIINAITHSSILEWPGRGNPQFFGAMGFQLPNQELAPYFDRNGNSIYEPMLGDYPTFDHGNSAAISDEILWSVFNDNGNLHTQTNGQPLNFEVQRTVYAFSCMNNASLSKTLFVRHKVINRANSTINDFYFGLWTDPDLGCANDDYIGTDTLSNTIYAYNQDNNDDNPCGTGGAAGYGANPPAQAITFLNQNLSKSIYHINSGSDPKGDPNSALGYYRLLSGVWPNGTPITQGGDGYDPVGTNYTNYIFPTNPNTPGGWSMVSESLSGLDQRVIGSVYKDSIVPGEAFTIDVAYSFHRDLDSNNIEVVNLMLQEVAVIQQYYNSNYNGTNCTQQTLCTSNCVFPGDANNNGIVNDFDFLDIARYQGNPVNARAVIGDNWMPYTPPTPITNAHLDCDGDGTINTNDFGPNWVNFNKTSTLYTGASEGDNTLGTDLFFTRFYNLNPTPSWLQPLIDTVVDLNDYLVLDVNFGDTIQTISNVHSVTFRVEYDEDVFSLKEGNVVGPGQSGLDVGWLNDDGTAVFGRQINEDGLIHFVASRTNNTNYTNGGKMGRLIFRVKITAPVNTSLMNTQICFKDFRAIQENGTIIPIGGQCTTIEYQDSNFISSSTITLEEATQSIRIYPNPSNNIVNIDLGNQQAKTILLYNLLGEELFALKNKNGIVQIAKKQLPKGMYTLFVQLESGAISSHKIIFN
jgi:hypothetical protein